MHVLTEFKLLLHVVHNKRVVGIVEDFQKFCMSTVVPCGSTVCVATSSTCFVKTCASVQQKTLPRPSHRVHTSKRAAGTVTDYKVPCVRGHARSPTVFLSLRLICGRKDSVLCTFETGTLQRRRYIPLGSPATCYHPGTRQTPSRPLHTALGRLRTLLRQCTPDLESELTLWDA
jgi:hypothetical protein